MPSCELGGEGGERRLPLAGQNHLEAQRAAQKRQLQNRVALIRCGPELACADVGRLPLKTGDCFLMIISCYSNYKTRQCQTLN